MQHAADQNSLAARITNVSGRDDLTRHAVDAGDLVSLSALGLGKALAVSEYGVEVNERVVIMLRRLLG